MLQPRHPGCVVPASYIKTYIISDANQGKKEGKWKKGPNLCFLIFVPVLVPKHLADPGLVPSECQKPRAPRPAGLVRLRSEMKRLDAEMRRQCNFFIAVLIFFPHVFLKWFCLCAIFGILAHFCMILSICCTYFVS